MDVSELVTERGFSFDFGSDLGCIVFSSKGGSSVPFGQKGVEVGCGWWLSSEALSRLQPEPECSSGLKAFFVSGSELCLSVRLFLRLAVFEIGRSIHKGNLHL